MKDRKDLGNKVPYGPRWISALATKYEANIRLVDTESCADSVRQTRRLRIRTRPESPIWSNNQAHLLAAGQPSLVLHCKLFGQDDLDLGTVRSQPGIEG